MTAKLSYKFLRSTGLPFANMAVHVTENKTSIPAKLYSSTGLALKTNIDKTDANGQFVSYAARDRSYTLTLRDTVTDYVYAVVNDVIPTETGAMVPGDNTMASFNSVVTIQRAANTTPYSNFDVVGGLLNLTNMAAAPGGKGYILSTYLQWQIASIPTGMTTYRLELYKDAPASNYADNAAWDLAGTDRDLHIGTIELPSILDKGSTLAIDVDELHKPYECVGTSLYAYLVTTGGGYTPAANSEVGKLIARAVSL